MAIGAIFLITALFLLSLFIVARPIIESTSNDHASVGQFKEDAELSILSDEHDRLLLELKELDFDNQMGKISESDYYPQRSILIQTGAILLQRIDEINKRQIETSDLNFGDKIGQSDLNGVNQLNGLKDSQTNTNHIQSIASPDDELEVLIANRKRSRVNKADGFCPNCGAPHQVFDRFCPRCGEKIITVS